MNLRVHERLEEFEVAIPDNVMPFSIAKTKSDDFAFTKKWYLDGNKSYKTLYISFVKYKGKITCQVSFDHKLRSDEFKLVEGRP